MIPRIENSVVYIEDKNVNVFAFKCAVAMRSDTIPQLARLICIFHGNVNVELITQPLSSFYVGGTKHLNNFDSKQLFEVVEMALIDTASRTMAYRAAQPQTFGILGK